MTTINLRTTITADDLTEFMVYQLIDACRCEVHLSHKCEDPADRKGALKRLNVIKKELVKRFKLIKQNGIRYAVIKEEKEEFDNGIVMCYDLYEVSNYVSNRNFTFRNVGRPVALYDEDGNFTKIDFSDVGDKPFDIVIKECDDGIKISIVGDIAVRRSLIDNIYRTCWYLELV